MRQSSGKYEEESNRVPLLGLKQGSVKILHNQSDGDGEGGGDGKNRIWDILKDYFIFLY